MRASAHHTALRHSQDGYSSDDALFKYVPVSESLAATNLNAYSLLAALRGDVIGRLDNMATAFT